MNYFCTARETLLRSCWHKTPTKRPTASEIVELLSNNPRLISPCIDVPLASVQVERTDSLELIPFKGKSSKTHLICNNNSSASGRISKCSKDNSAGSVVNAKRDEYEGNSGPYSPMCGYPNGGPSFRYGMDIVWILVHMYACDKQYIVCHCLLLITNTKNTSPVLIFQTWS